MTAILNSSTRRNCRKTRSAFSITPSQNRTQAWIRCGKNGSRLRRRVSTTPYQRAGDQNNGLGEFTSEQQNHWSPNHYAAWSPLNIANNWIIFLYADWIPLLNTTNANRSFYFRQAMIMTDTVIEIGNVRFPVHRYILAKASSFFASIFHYHSWTTNVIRILECATLDDWEPQPDPVIFRAIIEYVYTGQLFLTTGSVIAVYIMADFLLMADVTTKCADFMSKNISIETICQFASLASFHSLRPLLDNCVHFFIQHLEVISHRPDYKSILPAFMKRVFAMDDLVQVAPVGRDIMTAMDREIAVLGYVLKYLSHHVYDYVTCAEVFPMVRLNDITPTIVSHEMRSVRKLYRNTEVTRLVNLGRILFNLRDETLVEDPANCIPLSWRRHRVPAHFRVSSTPPRAFSILSIFEISKIVIGIRNVDGFRIINMIEVLYRTKDSKIETSSNVFGDPDETEQKYEIELEDNEHITRCTYATVAGHLTRMEFTTDLGFVYGPLGWFTQGDVEVEEGELRTQPGGYTHLHSLDCVADLIEPGVHYLHRLSLTWVHFD